MSGASWEKQVPVLLHAGYRVITYDRRGFGKSSQPSTGYDYHTFAEDLRTLITHLKLHDFSLVGFSMGGGEVARYLGKYGSRDVSKAVIISGVPPFLLKTGDNPEGMDGSVFAGIEKAVAADRYAFFTEFFKNFYNTDIFLGKRVSEQAVQASWNVGASASATASLACVAAWHEDFGEDLARIDVPTLVIHGDADRILSNYRYGTPHRRAHQRRAPARREGRPTLHHVDTRGRSKRRIVELLWRDGRQVAKAGCLNTSPSGQESSERQRATFHFRQTSDLCLGPGFTQVFARLAPTFMPETYKRAPYMPLRETRRCWRWRGPTPKYYGHRRLEWRIFLSWTAAKQGPSEERGQPRQSGSRVDTDGIP